MKFKQYIILLLFSCIVFTSWSQTDSISNSFAKAYKRTYPSLHYSYDEAKQIHNYSGNWDFDLDGKTDQLFFVGTGGAHLYYYLRLVLSSDGVVRNYEFLESDLPVLPDYEQLKQKEGNPMQYVRFTVEDFNGDGNKDIYIQIDFDAYNAYAEEFSKAGIYSDGVLITFNKTEVQLTNYF